jgi:hydrogenase nickel incorporation protein HypA/HybF
MHELSLVSSILDTIAPKVPSKKALREVHVTVGPLSGVWPEALRFGFEELSRQEGYLNAVLVIRQVPVLFVCESCQKDYQTDSVMGVCPSCSSMKRRMVHGSEFTLDSIEIEE